MEAKFTLDVYVCDDYTEGPNIAIVVLSEERIGELLTLMKEVIRLKLNAMSQDDPVTWLDEDLTNNTITRCTTKEPIGLELIKIFNDQVHYVAMIKDSNIEVYTDPIMLEDLVEIYNVMTTPKDELPLHLHDLKSKQAKEILQQRLKEVSNMSIGKA